MKTAFFVAVMVISFCAQAQGLGVEPYRFVSKSLDTVQAELGMFKVLENRQSNGKDSIQLSFIRFKSTNPNPGYPIIYLAGGPGGSGTETAKGRRFELFMKLREVADVIAFDQRATGMSQRIPDCPFASEFSLDKAYSKEEYMDETVKTVSKCMEFWREEKVDIHAYNTTESAYDIEALRKVLGVDKVSLWGISYGSHLAFEYIRLFENHLDKVVLASLEGPDETIKLPSETEKFLIHIAERAKENYGSDMQYPNLMEKIKAVHERLKLEPAMGTFKNRNGSLDTVAISNFELQSAIATFYLKNPEDSKKLPRIYSEMYAGDFSGIAYNVMIIKRYVYSRLRPMPFAMDMQSGISDERRQKVMEQINTTILGSTINFLLFECMMQLDFPQLSDGFRTLDENEVKALLLSGTMDGRTYIDAGIEIAKKFRRGKHVIIENAGHDLYMQSPIIGELVLNFYRGDNLNVDTLELKPKPFE